MFLFDETAASGLTTTPPLVGACTVYTSFSGCSSCVSVTLPVCPRACSGWPHRPVNCNISENWDDVVSYLRLTGWAPAARLKCGILSGMWSCRNQRQGGFVRNCRFRDFPFYVACLIQNPAPYFSTTEGTAAHTRTKKKKKPHKDNNRLIPSLESTIWLSLLNVFHRRSIPRHTLYYI